MGLETAVITAVAGSSLLGAQSALQQGATQAAAGRFNQQIAERNAKVLERQQDQIDRSTALDIARFRKNFDRLQGAASQAFRYNGWVASGGTPLQVLLANASEADEEIALTRYNAEVGKQQLQEEALNMRLQGRLQRMYGQAARRAGYMQAATSLLQGAAQGYSLLQNQPTPPTGASAYSSGESAAPTFKGPTGIPFGPAEGYTGG